MSEEDKEPNWLEDLSTLSVGGLSAPSAPGLVLTFNLDDLKNKPEEAMEKFKNTKHKKFYWKIFLHNIAFYNDAFRQTLADGTEKQKKKLKYIEEFEADRKVILKLSPTATKQLSKFILKEDIKEADVLKYYFKGQGRDTEFHFKKV